MRVAVLGCGPAGLMAVHAATLMGVEAMVVSTKEKSKLFGAQYLHAPIPYMTEADSRFVDYRLVGTPEDYRRKVYGTTWDGNVSPEDLTEPHRAWDIRATYDKLWATYSDFINEGTLDAPALMGLMEQNTDVDLWINTIPMIYLCPKGHSFGYTQVWAAGDAPELGIDIGAMFHQQDETVTCNGEESPAWYRLSRIYGHTTVEWPHKHRPPVKTVSLVPKPTQHNCDCFPGMLRVGRYGAWEKGTLSHSAFIATQRRLEEVIGGKAAKEAQAGTHTMPGVW